MVSTSAVREGKAIVLVYDGAVLHKRLESYFLSADARLAIQLKKIIFCLSREEFSQAKIVQKYRDSKILFIEYSTQLLR